MTMRPVPRRSALVAAGLLAAAAATTAAGASAASVTARTDASTGPPARAAIAPAAAGQRVPVFGSPTVVDNYRPGFEPDIAVDRSPGGQRRLYTSTPFGFSTTQSFIERSDDTADSFHLVEGNVAGKPGTCAGGGDTEAQVDRVDGSLYFADLQGLTNYSNSRSDDHGATFNLSCASVTTPVVDRQWIGLDTNGGTTGVRSGGRAYFDYDNVAQASGANQLVINQSVDGVQYGAVCAAGVACTGPATVISPDEGLPGNLIVDDTAGGAHQHSVYAAHGNGAQTAVVVSICRGAAAGKPASAAAAADYCTDPTAVSTDGSRLSTHWHDVNVDIPATGQVDKAFNVIQTDTAGNLYMTWASAPVMTLPDGTQPQTKPAQIFLATSTDGGEHWSPRRQINQPAQATNIFPWISAGDPGRIDIGWYGSEQTTGKVPYDSDSLDTGLWDVYLGQSLDALSATPSFTVTKVSDHHVKYGNISTGGLGGASDRSLGDYMQVQTGVRGEALLSYVDDTSTGRNQDFTQGSGQSPPEAAGPTIVAKQIGGPSLYAAPGDLGNATPAVDAVTAPTGNAFFSAATTATTAPAAQDLTGVAVTRADATHLTITLTTADPKLADDLAVSPTLGGSTGVWQVRWAERYEPALLDGAIRYVGMQSTAGQPPSFFTGTTTCIASTRCKFFSYPTTTSVPGRISGASVSWTVPLNVIGSPKDGDTLYSVTGTTVSQLAPSTASTATLPTAGDPANSQLPNTLDAAPSFSYTLRPAAAATATTGGTTATTGGTVVAPAKKAAAKRSAPRKPVVARKTPTSRQPVVQPKRTLAFTGLAAGLPTLAVGLLVLTLVLRRTRRGRPSDGSGGQGVGHDQVR